MVEELINQCMPKIGAHVSTAGGIYKCIENAKNIGAETIQIFGSSPQQWRVKAHSDSDVAEYKGQLSGSGIGPVFLHASYLVNIASPDGLLIERSIKSLSEHLYIAETIGADGLIFHIGSGKESSREEAIEKVVKAMKSVLKNAPGNSFLIMENSAGAGQKIGATPEELGAIMKKINSPRIKICIDTAHAFEAGMIEKYDAKGVGEFFDRLDVSVGTENIKALHVNDSKTAFNSHHDRHENIGEGHIGLDGFRALAKESRAQNIPWILEVPGFDDTGPDKKNIDILKKMF